MIQANNKLEQMVKLADLNVGGILILPKGFKLAPKSQIPARS